MTRFDANGNGKIDVTERKRYVRELSRKRRAEIRELARQRPKLNHQERMFYRLPRLTPALVVKYDTDGNGKVDIPEQAQIMQDAAGEARKEFRRFDKNSDGVLDKAEVKSLQAILSQERRARAAKAAEARSAPPTPAASSPASPAPAETKTPVQR